MAIQLSKNGNAVKFDFDDNSHYLNDGTIEVPVNSLTLVTDESNMFTFKKAASDDIFISGLYEEIGMSKSELIAWYKDNMVGSTGGGGGVTSGEVQTMIDESVSGLAESSAVTEEISEAVSGKADSSAVTEEISAAVSGKADSSAVTASINAATSGKADTTAVTQEISAAVSGKADLASAVTDIRVQDILYGRALQYKKGDGGYSTKTYFGKINDSYIVDNNNNIPNFSLVETSAVTSSITSSSTNSQVAGAKAVYDAIGDKADSSVVNTLSGKVDTNEEVVSRALNTLNTNKADLSAMTVALSGKQDTLSAGSGITIDSANTISCTVEGGGKAISGGTNISVTTGATADTVNCTLPISHNGEAISIGTSNLGSSSRSVAIGDSNTLNTFASNSLVGGQRSAINYNCGNSIAFGYETNVRSKYSFAFGTNARTSNQNEFSTGIYNNSVSGSTTADNTLFSVGNGTADNARHNAFEIRQNGDIYVNDGTNDVRLQDTILALGGMKLVQISQNAYDQLATKDPNTLYIITNVVS